MKFGRGHAEEQAKPLVLPECSQTVTLVPAGGKGLPARVLERSADTLLVAIMVPTEPLSQRQLEGIVIEFLGAQGRVRLTGGATVENPAEPDVMRIDRPRSVEVLQEREYVRIKIARPALVYSARSGMPIQSFTVDISGGGFLLAGSDVLAKGDEVEFQLTLVPGTLVIGGKGRVVRLDPKGHRAVAFESITEVDRRRLIRFIFDCQRAERQRGLA
jgi:PilZ domain